MTKKESTRYTRQKSRVDEKFVTRPNEILKSNDGNGNLKLTFKSPEYYEKDLIITDKSLLSKSQVNRQTETINPASGMTLNLSNAEIILLNLSGDTLIEDIINYKNGSIYKIFVKQDEVGGHVLSFDDSITNLEIDDDIVISGESNSYSQLKIICEDDIFYIEYYNDYLKYIQKPTGSLTFTIDTTLGSNAGPSYKLQTKPDYESITKGEQYTFNYDFIVDWGDGTSDHITSAEQPENNHTYSENGQYTITITGLCEAFGFFYLDIKDIENGYINQGDLLNYMSSIDFEKVTTVGNLGNIGLKDASYMFGNNLISPINITSIDATNWDVSNVSDMRGMFSGCASLTNIDVSNWDVSNVSDMRGMFIGCKSLTNIDVSNWDVSNVTDMNGMFSGCASLTNIDVSNWDVSNVSNMQSMFFNCSSLTNIDVSNWDVSNVSDMRYMFRDCTSLTNIDVSNWDVSNVSNMQSMFYRCSSLTNIDVSNWDVSNVSDMGNMFFNCSSLTNIDVSNWDVSNVSNMQSMFFNCSSLTNIDVSNWDVFNVSNMRYMFTDVPLDIPSYDSLLIGWSSLSPNLQNNVSFTANLAKYTPGSAAEAGRDILINTHKWTIGDAGPIV